MRGRGIRHKKETKKRNMEYICTTVGGMRASWSEENRERKATTIGTRVHRIQDPVNTNGNLYNEWKGCQTTSRPGQIEGRYGRRGEDAKVVAVQVR